MHLFRRYSCIRPLPRGMFLAALCAAMLGWDNIGAATLIVTTTADSGAGSLRAVIAAATDGDAIEFDPGLNGQTIALTSGELVINKDITINGLGADSLAVARTTSVHFRIFHMMPGHTVTIAGLTINGGYADGTAGGILNEANLTINDCIVSNNFSDGGGGGGGIYSAGTLTISNSVVTSNLAGSTTIPQGYGGGIYAVGLTIIHSTISNNTAAIDGGGIIGYGTVTITDSTISGNRCGSDTLQFGAIGGGLYVDGTVEIRNSTISGNTASPYRSAIRDSGEKIKARNALVCLVIWAVMKPNPTKQKEHFE